MASTMRVEVEGVEISPEEVTRAKGWRTAGEKLTQAQQRTPDPTTDAQMPKPADSDRRLLNLKTKLLKAARMPELPREDIKIIMRPRGGLDISDASRFEVSRAIAAAANVNGEEAKHDVICPNKPQNIVIVSTPKRANADRYAAVDKIIIYGVAHEVSAYESAPHGTAKGVIRGVPLTDTAQDINDNIVHEYNPTALQANRIGRTGSVIIAFHGPKVPNYIKYGNLLIECSLYRKQIDLCFQCGRLGHRMDVCPKPNNRICRGCDTQNPDDNHKCTPKCRLCGGDHLTADKICKARYKTPYVVQKRRWERRRAAHDDPATDSSSRPNRDDAAAPPPPPGHRSRRSLSRDGGRADGCDRQTGPRARTPGAPAAPRRRESRSGTRNSTPKRLAGKQVGWAAGSPVALNDNTAFPPRALSHTPPPKMCTECSELKKQIEKQNLLIQALTEKVEALTQTRSSDDGAKRKVAKKDTPQDPSLATPTEQPTPTSPSTQPPASTMETIMNTLSQMATEVTQIASQVTVLKEQMGNVAARLDAGEAKYSQITARMATLDARLTYTQKGKRKGLKGERYGRPHTADALRNDERSHDEEED